jgi:hypothetical protein
MVDSLEAPEGFYYGGRFREREIQIYRVAQK